MSNVWYTSDLHFGHRLVAGHRGFFNGDGTVSTKAHDEDIVETWNIHVRPNDTVWILGDMSMKGPKAFAPYVERLNGALHLIVGNHDAVHPMHRDSFKHQREWLNFFESVQAFAKRKISGQYVALSHFPYDGEGERPGPDRHVDWRLRDEGLPLIHGHTHDAAQRLSFSREGTPMLHVGWDAWTRPVSQNEIAALLDMASADLVGSSA